MEEVDNFKVVKSFSNPGFALFESHTIGSSHLAEDLPYQDYALFENANSYSLITVCDGHGGGDYFRSERGSRLAAECFRSCVQEAFADGLHLMLSDKALRDDRREKELFRQLFSSFVYRWRQSVIEDSKADPFSESEMGRVSESMREMYLSDDDYIYTPEAYGTTFIGAVLCSDMWFACQIGDGDFICIDENGALSHPMPGDEDCFLNYTTSMCDSNAVNKIRYIFSDKIPLALFVSSDGIDKSLEPDSLDMFYWLIYESLNGKRRIVEIEDAVRQIASSLPLLSQKGSGDDSTLAGIVCTRSDMRQEHSGFRFFNTIKSVFSNLF